jgi:hypothetical protein
MSQRPGIHVQTVAAALEIHPVLLLCRSKSERCAFIDHLVTQ